MRKFLALLLAVMMIASMSVTAFAAEEVLQADGATTNVESNADVKVTTTVTSGTVATVYYVVVTWQDMDFTYTINDASTVTWDPQTHTYIGANNGTVNGQWDKTVIDKAVRVENHSNTAVTVTTGFGDSAATTATNFNVTATISYDNNEKTMLANGEGLTKDNADYVEYDVGISNTVPANLSAFTIGVIKVKIAKA